MATTPSAGPAKAAEASPAGRRERVDIGRAPWNAVGQVNNAAYGRCTGVLIGPSKALTAAHCVYNARTGRFLPPDSVHFVLGYDRGRYVFASTLSRIEIPEDYDPARPLATIAFDIAVVHLENEAPASIRPLEIVTMPPDKDAPLAATGFGRDRRYALTAVMDCTLRTVGAMTMRLDDCPILAGYSGGPVIDRGGRLVAIQVARGGTGDRRTVLAVRPTQQFD